MANQKLTERRIERLAYNPGGPSRQIEWDTEITSFGVRLYPSGKKSFVLQYGPRTKRQLLALGQVGRVTLEQARGFARERLFELAKGHNPLEERRSRRSAQAHSVNELITAFLNDNEHRWSRSHASETRRRLEGPVSDAIGHLTPSDVGKADVNKLHTAITKGGAPVEANRVRTIVHTLYEWAADFGYVPEDHRNPAKKRRGSSAGRNTERSRERYLKLEEATKLLAAADRLGYGAIVRLWLLTGLRRSELLHRRWSDIDWKRRTLTVPNTKNGTTHILPLSNRAMDLFKALQPDIVAKDAPIFPGRGDEPLVDFKKPWRQIRRGSGLSDLTIHDLRRTVGTWLASLSGTPITTVSALLNHQAPGGVTAIYTRPMDDAVRNAVNELERLLVSVEPEKQDNAKTG